VHSSWSFVAFVEIKPLQLRFSPELKLLAVLA
jgi:hypothetical protein